MKVKNWRKVAIALLAISGAIIGAAYTIFDKDPKTVPDIPGTYETIQENVEIIKDQIE